MTKLMVAYSNFANAPKNQLINHLKMGNGQVFRNEVNTANCMNEENKSRINLGNARYCSVQNL